MKLIEQERKLYEYSILRTQELKIKEKAVKLKAEKDTEFLLKGVTKLLEKRKSCNIKSLKMKIIKE